MHAKKTIIDQYSYVWNDVGRSLMALPLGLGECPVVMRKLGPMILFMSGSIFNHSREPNVTYRLDKRMSTIEYTTTRQIQSGEELCIYYGSDDKLWFPMKDAQPLDVALESRTKETLEGVWSEIASLAIDEPNVIQDVAPAVLTATSPAPPKRKLFQQVKIISAEELEETEEMPVSTSESCYLSFNRSMDQYT